MAHDVGYCCINTHLSSRGITTNRSMRKDTFLKRGISYASELALANALDLVTILKWNAYNGIKVFRVSSGIFPWGTEYNLTHLPDIYDIHEALRYAGEIAYHSGQRLSAHPDHFVKLASLKPDVVNNSIKDLELHSTVFDLMGLRNSYYNPINIHVGMNYSPDVVDRFIAAYDRLSPNCRSRLVVENDDKANAFSVKQLYDTLFSLRNIPITFDYFHHTFHDSGLTTEEAARLAASTWPIRPLFHYSESKNINENISGNLRAHADYVFNLIDDFGMDLDIDLEAKAKEQALFRYNMIGRDRLFKVSGIT